MQAASPFHIMTKPIGPICNLDCKYCFYLEKEKLWDKGERFKMSEETLETYIRGYIEAQPTDQITFAWQGGEPTLMGVDFFRKVVSLQKQYANGKTIDNAFQTNGTLLNDEWGQLLHEHNFLIGLSIDGPQKLHDAYRVGKTQKGSYDQVMRGLEYLKKHQVEWNSLTCVHRANSTRGEEVYRFLKGIGSKHMQFIPIVERKPNQASRDLGLDLASPVDPEMMKDDDPDSPVYPWSVKPRDYGTFLTSIFDRWVRKDVGRIYIQINDVTFAKWIGQPGGLCIFEETCGRALALEHDGKLYSCDHFVYPTHQLGNILEDNLTELVESAAQKKFGENKKSKLPQQCIECPVKPLCNGGCPKQRFIKDKYGNPGLHYLCEGYYHYFTHTAPYMQKMAELYKSGQPPAAIMQLVK